MVLVGFGVQWFEAVNVADTIDNKSDEAGIWHDDS